MAKFKRFISVLLAITMLCTTFLSTGMIVDASLLPLEEKEAFLILHGKTDEDLSSMTTREVLDMLVDSNGDPVQIPDDATTVWRYVKSDDDGIEEYTPYPIQSDKVFNLLPEADIKTYTMELIIGSDKQLDRTNVRYTVKVYITNIIQDNIEYELYLQGADGTRSKVTPERSISAVNTDIYEITANKFVVPEPENGSEYYFSITSIADDHPHVTVEVYDFLSYCFMGTSAQPVTDFVLNQDMSNADAGLPVPFGSDAMLVIIYFDTNGTIIGQHFVSVAPVADISYIEAGLYAKDGNEFLDVVMTNVRHIGFDDVDSIFAGDGVHEFCLMLKEGVPIDSDIYCVLNAHGTTYGDDANSYVVKAVEGHYATLEEASSCEDIKNQLIPADKTSSVRGYRANYNYNDGGVPFTIFFEDGSVWKVLVLAMQYESKYDPNYFRAFTEMPIIGEADPWLRVTGATDKDGTVYSADNQNAYIVENGKSINMDTYYGYGYQTVFILSDDVDLSELKPSIEYADRDRVYAVLPKTNTPIDKNHVRNFLDPNQQYTGVIDGNDRNYWVTFKKLNNNGPELFVYGPSEREVILDEYFEFKHDILIANIGNAPLKDISVELFGAENVKLDPYWTVGGDGNDTLAAFTTTSSGSQYGELANMAKIRLLPDGNGTVKGTLVIRAKDQEPPVMITLNGTAQNPEIVTEELDDAVKYVPYQHIIATNNMHDWVETEFYVTQGTLPPGITLNSKTGEIYGVPTVPEGDTEVTYTFTVEAKYLVDGKEGYFDSSYREYQLLVKPNTDENVYNESDEGADLDSGYTIKQHLGTQVDDYSFELEIDGDELFISHGRYDEFVKLWLNGVLLTEDVDYYSEEGSTVVTIIGQTLENNTKPGVANTIAMEFRKDNNEDGKGDDGAEMNRTSQNFVIIEKEDESAIIAGVIELINAIPSVITTDAEDEITAARTAYDALTDSQKELVTNYGKLTGAETALKQYKEQQADQAAANKVDSLIVAIPSTITSEAKDEIAAARAAYNALTNPQKNLVKNYSKLEAAEEALLQYEKQQADKAAANKVDNLIAAIPPVINADARDEIAAARTAYNALNEEQAAYVENYDRLQIAEAALKEYDRQQADKAEANKVAALITAIPSVINADARDEIAAARAAYDALTKDQAGYVGNYNRLLEAEAALKEYDRQQADKAEANKVAALITAIPSVINADAQDEIAAARTAYDALTPEQQGYVGNYDRLTAAEAALKQFNEQQAQIAADKAAANKVVALIDDLPDGITLSDKEAVNNARTAYNALTAAQKGYVTNYPRLTAAEDKIVELEGEAQEQAKVNAVIVAIDGIPEPLTLSDKQTVEAARKAYEALTPDLQERVVNYNDLLDAEGAISAMEAQENADKADKAAAEEVIGLIDAIPEKVELTDKAAVEAVREAYDRLTDKQKELVSNYGDLTDAENAMKALEDYEAAAKKDQEAADAVANMINELPADLTLEDKAAVEAARAAYDALTDGQKEIVTNYDKLTDAEVKIAELENNDYEEAQWVTFVGILVDKDGKALSDKAVEIHSVVQNGRTDENGSFQFNNVEFGKHTVFVKEDDGTIVAQREFNIVLGSPLSMNGNEIVAENGSVFTVSIQVEGDALKFLKVESGNKAPVVDTQKGDETPGIDIGDDDTPGTGTDDDDGGIDIGKDDTTQTDKDDGIYIGNGNQTGSSSGSNAGNSVGNVTNPRTGNEEKLVVWYTLLLASLGGLVVLGYSNAKSRKYAGKYCR